MNATLLHLYPFPERILSTSQGNMKTLLSGSKICGWGNVERFTEFTPDGRVAMHVQFGLPKPDFKFTTASCGIHRFPWIGRPAGHAAISRSTMPRRKSR
jgi:hypothetical protein